MASESRAACSDNRAEKTAVVFDAFKPMLVVGPLEAEVAIPFYKAAFGAEEVKRPNQPLSRSAELKIGSSYFLVCDHADESAAPGWVHVMFKGISIRLETDDVKGAVERAVKAGAVLDGEIVEVDGPCGGGLVGKLKDRFGFVWIIASAAKASAVEEA